MQILSFDTCGSDVHIALMQNEQVVLQQIIPPAQKNRQEAASTLLPIIDKSMKELAWKKGEVDMIVVGVGPGSFTGVRVSVITARSIGQALGCAVVPISLLESIAFCASRPAAVVLNAGAGKYFAAAFDGDLLDLAESTKVSPFCGTKDEVTFALSAFAHWVVEPSLLQTDLISGKDAVAYATDTNWASVAALLARQRISSTLQKLDRESLAVTYPWDNVLPLYLRSPSVTLKAENGSSNKTPAGG